MGSHYVVRKLRTDQISQVFPLAELLSDNLTEEQWSEYAADLLATAGDEGHCGFITVQNERGTVYGLSAYRLRHDLRHGRILEIENFAALDLRGGKSATRELLKALEELAEQRECSCISVNLLNPVMRRVMREPSDPSVDLFRVAGYQGEPMRLRKCFDGDE